MDRELLKSLAAGRRNPSEPAITPRKVKWTCDFCAHDFASERTFMNHYCRERERLEELKSPLGQAAYAYYSEWMRLNKRSVPPIETFSASAFYTAFIKFARHVHRVKLPSPHAFVRAMVENGNVQPSLWCRDNVYALYLNGYDAAVSPTDQFMQSHDQLMELAREHGVEPVEVFATIGADAVLELVQRRKLSPWFLVASGAFKRYLSSCSEDDKLKLEDGVQVGAMIMRIQQSKKSIELFTEFTRALKEMNL